MVRLFAGVLSGNVPVLVPTQHPLDGDQAASRVTASDQLDRGVGISCPHRFGIVGNCFSGKALTGAGIAIGGTFSVCGGKRVRIMSVIGFVGALYNFDGIHCVRSGCYLLLGVVVGDGVAAGGGVTLKVSI
jgi:hypothetical protein